MRVDAGECTDTLTIPLRVYLALRHPFLSSPFTRPRYIFAYIIALHLHLHSAGGGGGGGGVAG